MHECVSRCSGGEAEGYPLAKLMPNASYLHSLGPGISKPNLCPSAAKHSCNMDFPFHTHSLITISALDVTASLDIALLTVSKMKMDIIER